MNTNKLKAYAPKARIAFMQAVTKRAAMLGLYEDRISDVSIQGDNAIIEGRVFTREQGQQRSKLLNRIKSLGTVDGELDLKLGFKQFINETAFTWFNRLIAIRYMEINGYLDHGFRVLSKAENATFEQGFEILSHAADVADDLDLDKSQIVQLMLDGDKEEELYREILLGQCHQLSRVMPFMFEALNGETELLLPDNLTKTDSILKALINELPEENWKNSETGEGQIEVIGWLYQFYISDHKDAVIGKVVKREDIPAATQLFTPNWIVKYLVQNSVGRQWLATYPESTLKNKMEYYITPAEQSDEVIEQLKAITPSSIDPETIKVLDPACGSGHILVEVYEVLREIYLERGYRLREIPELILTKNIFGLDIDDRAAQMAAFAVLMKAREDDKRIFSRLADSCAEGGDLKLNIYSMQSTENMDVDKLWSDLDFEEKQQSGDMADMFAESQNDDSTAELSAENQIYLNLLHYLKTQFIDAKNLGSLIEVDSQYQDSLIDLKTKLKDKALSSHQPTRFAVEVLLPIVEQAIILSNKYCVAVANPPYLSSRGGINPKLKKYISNNYEDEKGDLYCCFIDKCRRLIVEHGYSALVTMHGWMFIGTYEKFRRKYSKLMTVDNFLHLGPHAFEQIDGEKVQVCAFISSKFIAGKKSIGIDLTESESKKSDFEKLRFNKYTFSISGLNDLKGRPYSYWVDKNTIQTLSKCNDFTDVAISKIGLQTGNNDKFIRNWYEVSYSEISNFRDGSEQVDNNWYFHNKGGENVKWFFYPKHVVKWGGNGEEIKSEKQRKLAQNLIEKKNSGCWNEEYYLNNGLSYTRMASGKLMCYCIDDGIMFDTAAPTIFTKNHIDKFSFLGVLNSNIIASLVRVFNPTLSFQKGDLEKLPIIKSIPSRLSHLVKKCISVCELNANLMENSPYFSRNFNLSDGSIKDWCEKNVKACQENLDLLINNERMIDELVSSAYMLPITHKEYGTSSLMIQKNTYEFVFDLVSNAVGCSMGRYSLDQEGLVYAHSGNNGFKELEAQGAYKTFPADDDGIIPLASEEWLFEDDATARFKEFVKTVWGDEHLIENLDFVAESLCLDAIKPLSANKRGGEGAMDTIRRYFSTKFYKDHLKTYKNRPIYWLFSSGKEKAFECLVYLHRYNESTLARMRTEYVTPLMGKMETQLALLSEKINNESSTAEKARFNKALKALQKKQIELRTFDEELKHFAEMKINIDLDDGVKVNYRKFGNLLADVKAIHGKKPEAIK